MAQRVGLPIPKPGATGLDAEFQVSAELPSGVSQSNDRVSVIEYPVQVAVVSNWDVPRLSDLGGDEEMAAWPRISQMPPNGILLWILYGSVAVDYRTLPEQGKWFAEDRYTYLAPPKSAAASGTAAHPKPFEAKDSWPSVWENADVWGRLIPISGSNGARSAEPHYLMVFGFTGKKGAPHETLNAMVGSLEVSYP